MEGICFEVKPQVDPVSFSKLLPDGSGDKNKEEDTNENEIQFRLTLVGSLAVHPQTTMAMLPWVVAEIRKPPLRERSLDAIVTGSQVLLRVSCSWVQCVLSEACAGDPYDPLRHTVLFQQRPHHLTKLLHNSKEPSYFACLIRDKTSATCYVPEIISTLRQASKSSARQEDTVTAGQIGDPNQHSGHTDHPESATAFAKKFEVLFCGRAVVAQKNAPPALIDECIEKFSRANATNSLTAGIRRAFSLTQVINGVSEGADGGRRRTLFFRKDPSFPSLQALDENGLSPELHRRTANEATGVQPTSLQENRTMLFMGITHVDHFGFICRESDEGGSCQFVCYVFQCTDEALVDEIMLTLKQAFSVAALQKSTTTQNLQCLTASKAKMELQKHVAFLNNQEQACVFETALDIISVEPPSPPLLLQLSSPLRAHNSTGDLKNLETPDTDQEVHDPQAGSFRRRASTISHSPSMCLSSLSVPDEQTTAGSKPKLVRHYSVSTDSPHHSNGLRARLTTSSSVPNFLKFLAPVEEHDDSCISPKHRDVAALSSPGAVSVVGVDSPLHQRRHSWRQQIFLRVATPQKGSDTPERGEVSLEVGGRLTAGGGAGGGDSMLGPLLEERRKKSREELRELWKKAILQQILLLRMERENQKLQASESDLQSRRLKLDYEEITPCLKDVTLVWEKMLSTAGRSKVKFDTEKIHTAVGQGRTFPTHPYFSAQLGAGQLSLYNLLKAYSLLDPEVGYCQGLSFVAGVLLLHMSEEEAFNMLKFLMYDLGLRKQYRPDMITLQIQMYQLSRLLHDYHRELYSHLEQQEIGPSLYAAPWFLTAFASHFPLGFVARVFDMLFLQGSEVIFKVALSLLGSHKPLILQHDNLESIVDFIKSTLPNLGLVQMEKTINQVFEMDISKQLQAYEVEYHVLQDELLDGPTTLSQSQRAAQLEKTNGSLRQQNLDLLEEVQVAHARINFLESQVESLVKSETTLRFELSSLQQEHSDLQQTVTRLQTLLASHGIQYTSTPS
ncbi:TBC1 domain family member 1 [Bagarius yarrelli]|uniref:TBC1 domain family member 1 n=1 Tax=Bagarius yarrelli TaxID=175774 RepID=A0A556U8F5_BAGYA|nr:TBC1 domain family member 1 [Bagarius yarrelli]